MRKKKKENLGYKRYVAVTAVLFGLSVAALAGMITTLVVFTLQPEVYYGFVLYLFIPFLLAAIGLFVWGILHKVRSQGLIDKHCDVVAYTRANARRYDQLFGSGLRANARVTLLIDFHNGRFERNVQMPALLAELKNKPDFLKLYANDPEALMYYAFACYMTGDAAQVDIANTLITENKYFHRAHNKPHLVYATAFAVSKFCSKMLEGKYEDALNTLLYLKVTDKRHNFYDSLIRFCRARAEHELAVAAKAAGKDQEAMIRAKAALGKYAHIGRHTGNLYLVRQAAEYRVLLHDAMGIGANPFARGVNVSSAKQVQARRQPVAEKTDAQPEGAETAPEKTEQSGE